MSGWFPGVLPPPSSGSPEFQNAQAISNRTWKQCTAWSFGESDLPAPFPFHVAGCSGSHGP